MQIGMITGGCDHDILWGKSGVSGFVLTQGTIFTDLLTVCPKLIELFYMYV